MIVVAVPVHNEAGHIGSLLEALAAQRNCPPFEVVLLLNNCSDATADIVAGMAPSLPMRVHAPHHQIAAAEAHAGTARRLAMEAAARIAGPDGILLATDADSQPRPDWIARNLAALSRGCKAVAGVALIDPVDEAKLPPRLVAQEERVQLLTTLLDRIHDLLDPDPHDPWPRHIQHSGASIAVTVRAWASAGGIPAIPSGEDRAFFEALRLQDIAIRHAPDAVVIVSGRLLGRAVGGMADTMRRRISALDLWLDDPIEPLQDCIRRARARQMARVLWHRPADVLMDELAEMLCVSASDLSAALLTPGFGAAWAAVQTLSTRLDRRLVPAGALETEIARALVAVEALETARHIRLAPSLEPMLA